MEKKILTACQKKILKLIFQEKYFAKNFYLTGGTALSAFYLNHRLSEDLDFFNEKEFDPIPINSFLKKMKLKLNIKDIDYQKAFNRNIFMLRFTKEILKIEFTYYPFEHAEKPKLIGGIKVDSLLDIAINKVFSITQRTSARDFIDVYFILKENKNISFDGLLKKARIKFDWHIDPLHLGAQLSKVKQAKDLPIMLEKIDPKIWQGFFVDEARKLSKKIFL